jgi:thiol-disulfide isomerase/thioredoxin
MRLSCRSFLCRKHACLPAIFILCLLAAEGVYGQKSAPFTLGLYTENKKVSLSDYRGKVVPLTFWFPGCGPCRGEFPHLEHVIDRFSRDSVVYLAINVYGTRNMPTNYLIDRNGNVLFKKFQIEEDSGERTLELMIRSALD